ncbi:MAG TPA: hypothetical protein VHE60_11705 [Pyrinomonadaceae bacterium]|nr:hypothetical protein [Pyrinomonadaceae bacterium]
MNARHFSRWFWAALAAVFLTIPFFTNKAATQPQGGAANANVKTAGGLTVVTFTVEPGKIIVYLPDDMRAGDTISGTVVAEPKGQTPEERAKNMAILSGYVIELEPPRKPDGTSNPKVTITAQVTPALSQFTLTLQLTFVAGDPTPSHTNFSSTNSGGLGISLTNPTGSFAYEVAGSFAVGGTTTVPIEMVSLSLQSVAPLKVPQLPTIGQQGRPIEVFGPFDGNSSNTTLNWTAVSSQVQDFEKNTENVSGGFGLIAESPRKAIFTAPSNVTGPIELHLTEGKTQTTGNYRNVGINLTAPKTSLLKGESTELHVEVTGLQGLTQPVPLTLESHGVITMVGGNYQPLVIQPSQVGADGRYSTTRGITGVQTGGWTATGTVVTHRFDFCLQDDSNPRTVILINTFNGDYIFPQPGGVNLGGTGTVNRKGCIITLTDSRPDRRVQSTLDPCTQTGSASVQTSPPNKPKIKFTITDRNTTNNTCSCGPGCR